MSDKPLVSANVSADTWLHIYRLPPKILPNISCDSDMAMRRHVWSVMTWRLLHLRMLSPTANDYWKSGSIW